MLVDAQWMKLEPLIEACRPKGKTEYFAHSALRFGPFRHV